LQEKIIKIDKIDPIDFFGPNDVNIKTIKSNFPNLKIVARGDEIKVYGNSNELSDFEKKINKLINYTLKFENIEDNLIDSFLNNFEIDFENSKKSFTPILHGVNGKIIKAKTVNQRKIVDSVENNDLVFAIGPAGTGKTYTGIALAVKALKNKNVKRIILTRPAIEAGENLGFLPGDLKEKLDPYMQPLYDALRDMIPSEKLKKFLDDEIIQIAPLAFMRGRTLDNAFVILDEGQNTSSSQMKMFLTRMGKNAKFIVTGDPGQMDLPKGISGINEAIKILKGTKGVAIVRLDDSDVVRNKLVIKIIEAYKNTSNK
tara:strand:- start:107 stop:1051 length:945 start_codon:yes stop_codon:yes gene_type:complete